MGLVEASFAMPFLQVDGIQIWSRDHLFC